MVTKAFAFCHCIQCVWYWLKDCILECAQCQKKIIKGGGGVSVLHEGDTHWWSPLGLPQVVSFMPFCPPPATILLKWSQAQTTVLFTNMHLSVQFFFKPYFLPPYVYTTGTGCVWRVYCMENLSCQLRFSCGSSLDKRSSTREDVCRCHTPIESVSRRSLLLLLQGKDLPTPFAVFSAPTTL